jgi:spore coat polysaccharide biosynthesis protein SpsF
MKYKTVALIEARMNSSRLPGKVIKKLGQDSVIGVLIERVKKAKNINQIVVITTKNKIDDVLIKIIKKKKIKYFRGSELNVYDRFIKAAALFKADIAVRLTSDNPLIDPKMIDSMINDYKKKPNPSYLFNGYKSDFKTRQLPYGLDIELLNPKTLINLKNIIISKKLKEHPPLIFFKNKKKFFLKSFKVKNFEFNAKTRLTIDTLKDLKMLNQLYILLFKKHQNKFDVKDISNVLKKNKWLLKINGKIRQKKI